jgi:hypothetical protein
VQHVDAERVVCGLIPRYCFPGLPYDYITSHLNRPNMHGRREFWKWL